MFPEETVGSPAGIGTQGHGRPPATRRRLMAEHVRKGAPMCCDERIRHEWCRVSPQNPSCQRCGSVPDESGNVRRSEEHTSELQSLRHLVCRLLLEKNNSHF